MEKGYCRVCCGPVEGEYSVVEEDRELVIVDEEIPIAYILSKDDCLCVNCSKVVTYYRRIKE